MLVLELPYITVQMELLMLQTLQITELLNYNPIQMSLQR